ncbi:MAG TPA: VanW family protein [Polyangiaceae bacterium]|nr:VanW family protein [Polyangiaceae bacterium]
MQARFGERLRASTRNRVVLATCFLLPILLALSLLFLTRVIWGERAPHGVRVGEVLVGGLDRAALEEELRELDARLRRTPLSLVLAGHAFALNPEAVNFHVDVSATANAVFAAGRRGNVFVRTRAWVRRFFTPEVLPAVSTLDARRMQLQFDEWEALAISERPFDGGLRVDGERIDLDPPRAGQRIDRDEARRRLETGLGNERRGSTVLTTVRYEPQLKPQDADRILARAEQLTRGAVELTNDEFGVSVRLEPHVLRNALRLHTQAPAPPLLEFEPNVLERHLESLRRSVERAPRDAQFVIDARDRVSIVPSQQGTHIHTRHLAHALLEAAASPARSGPLPVELGVEPALHTDAALALHIERLVAEFSTSHACCQPRVQNIHRIAQLLDGALVKPGETFSLNARVGERTTKNGFVPAPSIQDGEMVDTVGGGVSQFATTFFNAVFHAGYDIIERQPHTYWFSRYPMGHEATLSWPKPDVIFKNDSAAGVLVKTLYSDTRITVKLYGNNGGRTVKARVSPRQDIVQSEVELVPNPDVPVTEEKVKEAGMEGWSVIVGRKITFADGRTKEEQRKVTYKPRIRRVEVHPCRIPEGEAGYTGERCPEPPDAGLPEESASSIDSVPP